MRRPAPIAILLGLLGALGLLAMPAEGATPLVRHTVPGIGFSIGVPSGWNAIDYRAVAKTDAFERLINENPTLAQLLRAIRDPNSGVRFLAADPDTTSGFATNMNLVVEKVPNGMTPIVYAASATRQLGALSNVIRPIRSKSLQLPAGPAARLRYGIRFSVGDRQVVVAITQYVLVRRTQAFVATYTTLPALSAKRVPVFEASARSIRLTR